METDEFRRLIDGVDSAALARYFTNAELTDASEGVSFPLPVDSSILD